MKLAECHPTRKHQARGMCKVCYDKWLKAQMPSTKIVSFLTQQSGRVITQTRWRSL